MQKAIPFLQTVASSNKQQGEIHNHPFFVYKGSPSEVHVTCQQHAKITLSYQNQPRILNMGWWV